ncbi:No apical meristem-associated C-terminal domain [Phytophthora infestans]|uniref:No apical meristem-associated C-terminal domain n=1 Tax=Phytophthora infestans TaxID=4787 RepID=A0A833W2J4_PHYIN|nr:No apical meristem-associated C-terminal domain [Phytophthora infestans]
MPRGSNFVEEEEIQLCMSYLKISEDPRTGTYQSSATFWKRIYEHFTAARPAGSVVREIRSLECKWSKISGQAQLFSAAMDKVERRSGASFEDEIQDAQQIYMRMEDRDGVTATKPFKLLHCWRILRSEPLWTSVRDSQGTTTGGDAINSESTARGARPQGRKASKEEAKAVASTSSLIAELAKANAEIAAASKKRARAIQDACDVPLFTVCLDELDPDSRRFFELRRRQVLGRLERSHASARETVVAEASVLDGSGDGCDDQDDTELGVYTAAA